MGKYAENTKVSAAQSRADIEKVLDKYGASSFACGTTPKISSIGFAIIKNGDERHIRLTLDVPRLIDFKVNNSFPDYHARHRRSDSAAETAWNQAKRQRWRALFIVIKAKLEGIESGIETFDSAFLPYIVLPNNQTVGQSMIPMIDQAYATGALPNFGAMGLLPAPESEDVFDSEIEEST